MESYFSRTYHCISTKSKNEYIKATENITGTNKKREKKERARQGEKKNKAEEENGKQLKEWTILPRTLKGKSKGVALISPSN